MGVWGGCGGGEDAGKGRRRIREGDESPRGRGVIFSEYKRDFCAYAIYAAEIAAIEFIKVKKSNTRASIESVRARNRGIQLWNFLSLRARVEMPRPRLYRSLCKLCN